VRGGLTCDELGTPCLPTMKRLVESAVVGADREEADDGHAERKSQHQPHYERFHLSLFRPFHCATQTRWRRHKQPPCHPAGAAAARLAGCLAGPGGAAAVRTRIHRAMNSQPGAPSGAAVVARGVRKRFGTLEALDGLDLEVRGGEIYGLLGPNGSGKTTFIRCLAGLIRPSAGEITVLGRTPRDVVAAGRVGYMTQAAALYGDLSVDENLEFFARLEGVEDPDERIEEVLRTVDLLDRRRSICLLYTSPSTRDLSTSRMPSSA